jgi:hypothetical protein
MLLDTINKTLEIYLGAAIAANNLPVTAFYVDHTSVGATPGASDTQTNCVIAVTILAAPAPSTQRQLMRLTVYNADTATATVYIRLNNNSTLRLLMMVDLDPGNSLHFSAKEGWLVMTRSGLVKASTIIGVNVSPLVKSPITDAANITAVTAMTTGVCHCCYMGVAPFATSSINLLASVTTAVATITWAEIAIYKGTPALNAVCPNLTRLGYVDVAAIYNATGIKNTAIPLTIPANKGDNIWVVMGSLATTPFQVRGALADNLQTGMYQTLTARPSLTPGPIASVLAVLAAVPMWIAIKYN